MAVGFISVGSIAQTSLEGKVTDDSGEPILFGDVAIFLNDVLVTGTQTDFEGNYSLSNIDPGTYTVQASYVGYQTKQVAGVVVVANKANRLNITLTSGVMLQEIEVVDYKVPLIEQDNTSTGAIRTAEQIKNLPVKDINSIASQAAGLSSNSDGNEVSIRGARTNQTNYYIDGVRVNGRMIPQTEIEQLQVLTGGISAKYGDVTGGIISITTKGPSDKFTGGLELETSEFLDPYGYNLVNANISGPILKNSEDRTILGFRLSGQYNYRGDDDPSAFGNYRATEEKINELSQDPIFLLGNSPIVAAERLVEGEGVEFVDARPNQEQEDLDIVAKIDARITENVDITFTGVYNSAYDRFSPDPRASNNDLAVFRGIGSWDLLNWTNNPLETRDIYRGAFRFRHRLGGSSAKSDEENAENAGDFIRNISYSIRLGFERRLTERQDFRHGENLFDYGYIGEFDVRWDTTFGFDNNGNLVHTGYTDALYGYNPANVNEALSNYNNIFDETQNSIFDYNAYNGSLANATTTAWNTHLNVGSVYNRLRKQERDRLTASLAVTFELLPGGSEKGRHNIELGVNAEQWVERLYEVRPFGLWTLARLYSNAHILGLDSTMYDSVTMTFANDIDDAIVDDPERRFFKSIRELKFPGQDLNENIRDYVNVDDVDPSQLSLDMFSAKELTDQNIVDYYGYDYLGNKTGTDLTFEDFFAIGPDGARTFNVAPSQPIYGAFYVQDRFTYKDIIFRLGVRADYYDANSKVLKDKYSLYPIMDAATFHSLDGTSGQPTSVDDDYKVYVTEPGSSTVEAYRQGDTWYNSNGTEVDPRSIFGEGGLVNPRYNVADDTETGFDAQFDPQNAAFDSDQAFEDYEPQWNIMPRLGFSFPISDEANFYAHYDVLVSRPLTRNIATALDYYYWKTAGRTPTSNPNLKPVRTIDYQVGFQQKLTNSSAIKLSAYYKEFRDLIQRRTLLFTSPNPVNDYLTYDNLDFGTVKGFTVQYDLRRTGNIELTAAYTLQFAEGTGSDDDSQEGLTGRGRNIRTLSPLSYDERHRFVVTADYRYASGKKYNGPRLFGKDIFANAGANAQITAVSGRPFTERVTPTRFGGTQIDGSINGARLPWNFNVDMRIDKSFTLNKGDDKRPLYLNVYFRVQNLFDTRNIIDVYTATGSADDDGFIASPDGQAAIQSIQRQGRDAEVDFFIESYNWRLLDPDNFSRPRRMYLGAIFEF